MISPERGKVTNDLSVGPGRPTAWHRYSLYTVVVLAREFNLNRTARRAQEREPRTLPQKGITAPVSLDSGVVGVNSQSINNSYIYMLQLQGGTAFQVRR